MYYETPHAIASGSDKAQIYLLDDNLNMYRTVREGDRGSGYGGLRHDKALRGGNSLVL